MLEEIDPEMFESINSTISYLSKKVTDLECQLNESNVSNMILTQRLKTFEKWSKMWKVGMKELRNECID